MTNSKKRFPELCDRKNTSRPFDTLVKMFPYSLFMHISYYTNGRLTVFHTIYTSHARLVKFFNMLLRDMYRSCGSNGQPCDLDRKSLKWRKKLLYRMLMFAAWVIYHQLHRHGRPFHVELEESVIHHAQCKGVRQKSRGGWPLKRACVMTHVGSQLPVVAKLVEDGLGMQKRA